MSKELTIATGGPPDTLNDRHRLLATYLALGYTNEEAGRELDLAPNRISIIRQSPLLQHEITQERKRIRERITDEAFGKLHMQAPKSVDRLIELGDQNKNLNVALGATNSILDRVVPKTTRLEEDRTLRIVFDAEILTDMREAMIEDGAFVEPEEALVLPAVQSGQAAEEAWNEAEPKGGVTPDVVIFCAADGIHEFRPDGTTRVSSLDDVLLDLRLVEALALVAEAEAEPA